MYILDDSLYFPHPSEATAQGIVALGGDLSAERLQLAYQMGIFPWYEKGQPIIWWSPDPRMVLFPKKFKVSKSLRRALRKKLFSVTYNQCFDAVVEHCSTVPRNGQSGTWITQNMKQAYSELYDRGWARSVEVWQDDKLVGGLYGVDLFEKKVFCGESMFATVSDASKVGFYYLVEQLKKNDYVLIDCQVYTAHLERLGAEEIDREAFLSYVM
jgi:leucyl/phenylalanyl-tRNA--protein transferase